MRPDEIAQAVDELLARADLLVAGAQRPQLEARRVAELPEAPAARNALEHDPSARDQAQVVRAPEAVDDLERLHPAATDAPADDVERPAPVDVDRARRVQQRASAPGVLDPHMRRARHLEIGALEVASRIQARMVERPNATREQRESHRGGADQAVVPG